MCIFTEKEKRNGNFFFKSWKYKYTLLLGFLQDLLFFCLGLLISELDELEEELEDCRRRRTAPEDVTTTDDDEEEAVEAAVTDDGVVEDVIIEVLDLVAILLFTDPPPLMAVAILLTIWSDFEVLISVLEWSSSSAASSLELELELLLLLLLRGFRTTQVVVVVVKSEDDAAEDGLLEELELLSTEPPVEVVLTTIRLGTPLT